MTALQYDNCNRGHLDKVDQSDYRKITIHPNRLVVGKSAARKKNNKLLEAQNLILMASVFQESRMFHQTMFFYSKFLHTTPRRTSSLAQVVILSCTRNFFAPVAALCNNMRPHVKNITTVYDFRPRHSL